MTEVRRGLKSARFTRHFRSSEPHKFDESQLERILQRFSKSRWETRYRITQIVFLVATMLSAIVVFGLYEYKKYQLEIELGELDRRRIVGRNLQWTHELKINPEPEVQENCFRDYAASYSMDLKNIGEVPMQIDEIRLGVYLGTLRERAMDKPGAFRINLPDEREEGMVQWRQVLPTERRPDRGELAAGEILSFDHEYRVLVDKQSFAAITAEVYLTVDNEPTMVGGAAWAGLDQLPRNEECKSNNFQPERVDEAIPPENNGA